MGNWEKIEAGVVAGLQYGGVALAGIAMGIGIYIMYELISKFI